MKVSYNNLNKFFEGKLPPPADIEKALTFHSWEVEEVVEADEDTMIDVKVLPDKSAWALSHRGIAKDLSVVLNTPLSFDPLSEEPHLKPKSDEVSITVDTPTCTRYIAAHIRAVSVGPSPEWLVKALTAIGQKSINNVVDITNYVMFGLGQPLHAFDAGKLKGLALGVRQAKEGETIVTLTGESYTLTAEDAVIVDGESDEPVGIAGVKGGKAAEIDAETKDIIIESAHFDAVAVRKTSQRLKLRTDASVRYENGVVPDMTAYGIRDAVDLILQLAGGSLGGYAQFGKPAKAREEVSVSLKKINSVLGLELSKDDVEAVIARFGYEHSWKGTVLSVTPPFERPDLAIAEDVIEEIGRIHGYDHVVSVTPDPLPLTELNKTFYYTDRIREALIEAGFSEMFTSSFRAEDEVKIKNALASDKGYLRSALKENMKEALARNAPNADLLGMKEIRAFEVGTVFTEAGEHLSLALGVSSPSGYKAKHDDQVLKEGMAAVEGVLGTSLHWGVGEGVAEAPLTEVVATLEMPTAYASFSKTPDITYKTFSAYPYVARDVAFWVTDGASASDLESLIRSTAGDLLVRLSLFDEFSKDGKTSYAFRLILQSYEKTLSDADVLPVMERVYEALKGKGYEIR